MDLKDFLAILKDGGPVAITLILGVLFWLERTERKEVQEENSRLQKANGEIALALLERTLKGMGDTKDAISELSRVFLTGGRQ